MRQLLADLAHYLPDADLSSARIDWTDATQEGHQTRSHGGVLEGLSGISVLAARGQALALGWFDFVHGSDSLPLFVFWLYLEAFRDEQWLDVQEDRWIPQHVWERLPESTRAACAVRGRYDARWCDDPKVAILGRKASPS